MQSLNTFLVPCSNVANSVIAFRPENDWVAFLQSTTYASESYYKCNE
jgi:hypothetical protein